MLSRTSFRIGAAVLAVTCLFTAGLSTAGPWLQLDPAGAVALTDAAGTPPTVTVYPAGLAGLQVVAETAGVSMAKHENKSGQFVELSWPDASFYGEVGTPALPVIRRLFVVPAGATVSLSYDAGAALTVDSTLTNMPGWVLPVQPPIPKTPERWRTRSSRSTGTPIRQRRELPAERVTCRNWASCRGQRLWLLEIRPVAHNPAAGTLTFWPTIAVDVRFAGGLVPGDGLSALPGLRRDRPEPAGAAAGQVARHGQLSDHRGQRLRVGDRARSPMPSRPRASPCRRVPSSPSDHGDIKTYIQACGGPRTRPTTSCWSATRTRSRTGPAAARGSPPTDLQYVCMDGTSDWYPDIAIGRFPVRNTTQLQAIVDKTLLLRERAAARSGLREAGRVHGLRGQLHRQRGHAQLGHRELHGPQRDRVRQAVLPHVRRHDRSRSATPSTTAASSASTAATAPKPTGPTGRCSTRAT